MFGFSFLLQQANIWDFLTVLKIWWPLIFIIIGIIHIFRSTYSYLSGLLFVFIGSFILVDQWIEIDLTAFLWPVILILIGLVFTFSKFNHKAKHHANRTIQTFSLFSGVDIRSESESFQGGSVTAVFGGVELDLRDIIISDDGAHLDCTALFGGISITIPDNVRVETTGIPIFGGWENKLKNRMNDNHEDLPLLKINCLAAFGGVEIRD